MPAANYTLITGATSRVGNAVATALGTTRPLVLHGRDQRRLEEVRQTLGGSFENHLWVRDLADIDGVCESLASLLASKRIGVDSFVHCAGVATVLPARNALLAATRTAFNVNCIAAQQIVGTLLSRRCNFGALRHIVFISSIYSRVGVRGHSIYCASKAALDGLMRALAVELAPSTRVNSIQPGAMDTPMAAGVMENPELRAATIAAYPLGIGTANDIAYMAAFLLSDKARWLTGQEIVVDGGRTVNFSLK